MTQPPKRPDHHTANGRFRNPKGSPTRGGTKGDMVKFIRKQLLTRFNEAIPEDHILSKDLFHQQLEGATDPSVTWLGHSAFILRLGGKTILTDPFLGKRAGPVGFGPKRYVSAPIGGADLPRADILLVSHNHYDHLDAPTIEAYRYKSQTEVIVPLGLGRFFTKRGYTRVTEQDWWESWRAEGIEVTTLPAIHNSGRGLHDKNKTLWASFGLQTDVGKVWFSGDTAFGPIFDEISQRVGTFDLALVAIGAYEPRQLMKGAHITPDEAVALVQKLGARTAIGMHWGTISLTPENPFDAPLEFRKAAHRRAFGAGNARVMRVGETLNLTRNNLTPQRPVEFP